VIESTNGGMKWREVDFTGQYDSLFERSVTRIEGDQDRGCTPVGCSVGPWLRVGWLGAKGKAVADTPKTPPEVVGPPLPVGRWQLRCAPTGEVWLPPAAPQERPQPAPEEAAGAALQSTAWAPFQGRPGPRRRPDEIGFDTGTEQQSDVAIRGYAWGARGAPWSKVGKFQIVASDPFALRGAVWTTAVGRAPWAQAADAARSFGQDSPTMWTAQLEPSGEAGALVINDPASHDLYLFERGRSIV
jgi:hypothetical protein